MPHFGPQDRTLPPSPAALSRASTPMKFRVHAFRSLQRAARDSSGQALAESALIISVILIPILVGTADLVRVFRASIAVANAARAGAQYAAQSGFAAQDSTGIQNAASAEAPNLTVVATPSYTCSCSDGTASPTCSNTACPNSHKEQTVTVTTTASVTPLVHLPSLPSTYTVRGQAILRCLQ